MRRAGIAAGMLAVLLTVSALGLSWWVAGQIWDGAFRIEHVGTDYNVEVVGYDALRGRVTLRAPGDPDVRNRGVLGLEWSEGYGRLGDVIGEHDGTVERRLEVLAGGPPGATARIDGFAFPGDPLAAHSLEFEETEYPAEHGPLPAWSVTGVERTWVIAVHGKGSERREALRLMPVFADHGLPVLVITYRDGREVGAAPDARYAYGATEWADLEGAVRYAIDAGAEDVILVGYSMGGAITMSFLYQSPLASDVRGVILDSPALDLAVAADMQLRDGGIPGWLTGTMRTFASWRYGIDWGETNYLQDVDRLAAPMLLLHGDADDVVPVETSRELARVRPDLVTYVELSGVGHVRGWNEAQDVYLDAIEAFLDHVVGAGDAGG